MSNEIVNHDKTSVKVNLKAKDTFLKRNLNPERVYYGRKKLF